MIIGKVVGSVISTRKNDALLGSKFLIVESLFNNGAETPQRIVAVDNVGAGIQELVLVATGSAARVGTGNEGAPVDACIVGIIDDPSKIYCE
ncbi:MAG: EutN/CcmL family microcompartment protein [Lachnospiraceae bacterium]|nr:EutN/CcmL family microcompartment protein [Lachnospiraceae bacterium]MDY5742277.1 EutN/CcmL family microcompartment protein [Lachnospiraceae bacterium]